MNSKRDREAYKLLTKEINRCIFDTSRIFTDFKCEIELKYEAIEEDIEMATTLIEKGQYSEAKNELHRLEGLLRLYQKYYDEFAGCDKDVSDNDSSDGLDDSLYYL